jgi:parvulin-like peptidyl-prolyl isomerase
LTKSPESSRRIKRDKVGHGTSDGNHHVVVLYLRRLGGSLGWKTRGSLLPAFEEVAFELEPSTTSNPKYGECKTSEGYHIIMVEGRK